MKAIHAFGCMVVLTATLAIAGDRRMPLYDDAVADGRQLAANGSFEALDRAGETEGWATTQPDGPQVVTNAGSVRHGMRAYAFTKGMKHSRLWGKLANVPTGPIHVSVWVKGKGQLETVLEIVHKDSRIRKGRDRWIWRDYAFSTVDSPDQWREVTWQATIPTDLDLREARHVSFQIAGRGNMLVDECTVLSGAPPEPLAILSKAGPDHAPGSLNAAPRPMVTVPRLDNPPVIDGRIAPGEWDAAAGVTGFVELSTMVLAKRQSTVYLGYTDRGLYVAFRCPHLGPFYPGDVVRDDTGGHQMVENVELWIVPPGKGWHQFYGNPAGGFLDNSQEGGLQWNGEWEFANAVEDVGEIAAGVQLFNRKIWTAELFVPFSTYGVDCPRPGDIWRANFCRDFSVSRTAQRALSDWTTWSPVTGTFHALENFGELHFGAKTAVRIEQIGDLAGGQLTLAGQCTGGPETGIVRISARALEQATGRTLSIQAGQFSPETGGQCTFDLGDALRVAGRTQGYYEIRAVDNSGNRLAESTIAFVAETALRARIIPIHKEKTAYVRVDASELPSVQPPVDVHASLSQNGSLIGMEVTDRWTSMPLQGDLTFSTAGLEPGTYDVSISLMKGGSSLAQTIAPLTVIEPPVWLGNTLGQGNDVPSPWKSISIDGMVADVTERRYDIGDLGVPVQIMARGAELFDSPPLLRCRTSEGDVHWQMERPQMIEHSDARATWHIAGSGRTLKLEGRVSIEFDGFILWDAVISPTSKEVVIESLALEFPFQADRALYARGKDATKQFGRFCCLLDRAPKADPYCHTVWTFNRDGWVWPQQWLHELWIGDDERGLSIMCETDEHLYGTRRTDIRFADTVRTAVITLIDGPTTIREPLPYRYMFQATPVKPLPTDPKRWHTVYHAPATSGALDRLFTLCDYWALKYCSYPEFRISRSGFLSKNKLYREQGVRIVPYFCTHRVTSIAPDCIPFVPEWECHPVTIITELQGETVVASPQSGSLRDFMAWSVHKLINDLGFDGCYLDVSGCNASTNIYQGNGYRRADEIERRPTVAVLASRELYKRLYRILKRDGRDAVLFRHGMPVAAVAGFVDYVTEGEGWGRTGMAQYDDITPEEFRAQDMRIQYGVPYGWYTFHQYWRGKGTGGQVPLSQVLAYALPHRVLPCFSMGKEEGEGNSAYYRTWDALGPWLTDEAEFLPYWREDCPVRIEAAPAGVLASVYRRRLEAQALVVVANWTSQEQDVILSLDLDTVGIGTNLVASRALEHPLRVVGERERDTDRMGNPPITLANGRIPLRVGPRNVELILLRQR